MKKSFDPDKQFRATLHQLLKKHLGRNRNELSKDLTEKIFELCQAHFASIELNAPLLNHSFEIFPSPLILTDTKPEPILINQAGQKFFEIKDCQPQTWLFSEIFDEPVVAEIIIRCLDARRTKIPQTFVLTHKNRIIQCTIEPLPTGNLIYFQEISGNVKNKPFENTGLFELNPDKSDSTQKLQQLMNDLIDSNKKNNALLEAIPDIIFVYDRETRFIDVKTHSEENLLLPPEHFIGKKADEVLPPYLAEINNKALEKVFATGEIQTYSYTLNVNGKERFYDTRMVWVDHFRAMAIVRDITDRVIAEQELKEKSDFINALMEAIPIPVFFKDQEGRYLGCNPAFTQFTGLSIDQIKGKTLGDIFNNDPFSLVYYQKDLELLQNPQLQQYEFKVRDRDGKARPVIFAKNVFRNRFGEIAGIIGVFVDISEQKQIQEELVKAKEKAEESERLKTAFLNNINHEIRTPMNSILGFADLLRENHPDETQSRQYLDVIESSSRRMLQTITNIIDMARIHSGEIETHYAPTTVKKINDLIEIQYKADCQAKGLDFRAHYQNIDPQQPFLSDESKIKEILSILVDNAIKFTPKGLIEIVWTKMEPSTLHISVKDTGIGIATHQQQMIFNAFEKITNSNFIPEGTGLGLAIAKALAEILDGTITLESQLEKGSTFTFTLPYKPILQSTVHTIPKIKNANILIIEDDPFSLRYYTEVLKNQGYQVLPVSDGHTAIEIFQQNPQINLVLLDIKLPDMDGFSVAQNLRAIKPDIKIVAQTAYASPEDKQKALSYGIDDFVAKPLEISDLLTTIEQNLSKI